MCMCVCMRARARVCLCGCVSVGAGGGGDGRASHLGFEGERKEGLVLQRHVPRASIQQTLVCVCQYPV